MSRVELLGSAADHTEGLAQKVPVIQSSWGNSSPVDRYIINAQVPQEWLKNQMIENYAHAYEQGIDNPEITEWKWPY